MCEPECKNVFILLHYWIKNGIDIHFVKGFLKLKLLIRRIENDSSSLYDRLYKLLCVSEMDSDPDLAIVAELHEIHNRLSSYTKQTENAFYILDNRRKAWSIRRREVLKAGTEKVLQVLSERDSVSLAKFGTPPL